MSPAKQMIASAPGVGPTGQDPAKPRRPLQTTVIGSYPFPGWLEFAAAHQEQFGEADIEEMRTDAVIAAVHDQVAQGRRRERRLHDEGREGQALGRQA